MEAKPYKIVHPYKKLKKELVDKIVQDIREGSTMRLAAESNGITHRILNIWILQGLVDLEVDIQDSLCAYLVLSLAEVRKEEVKWCRGEVKFNEKGHDGAKWTLEHVYWRDFSNNAPIVQMAEQIEDFKTNYLNGDKHVEANGENTEQVK